MQPDQETMAYLCQDKILHIDMLEALSRKEADIVESHAHGVLLRHHKQDLMLLSAKDATLAAAWLPHLQHSERIVVRQSFCQDLLLRQDPKRRSVGCIQHTYLHHQAMCLPPDHPPIQCLDESFLSIVKEHYSLRPDTAYLIDRFRAQALFGVFIKNSLAGFAGFHAQGALGMLEILPAYRRQGLGFLLQSYLTALALKRGQIPYTQIKCGNEASMRLQAKCGYKAALQPIAWIVR